MNYLKEMCPTYIATMYECMHEEVIVNPTISSYIGYIFVIDLIYSLTSEQLATAVLPCQRTYIHTCKLSTATYTQIQYTTNN